MTAPGAAQAARVPASCDAGGGCLTCGDVAVPLTVRTVAGADAWCMAADGREELVAVELVGPVRPGDVLLVHARVALERIEDAAVLHEGAGG